jgi:putative FmdB family regulatory protein
MPTYEYKCTACGHAFEQFQSITAAPVKRCPQCGKAKVKRLVSIGAGVIFKGSGFYITDYRDASYKEKAKAESGAGSGGGDSGASSDGKTETKSGGETKPAETKSASAESKPSESKPAASKPAKSDKPEKKSKK